MIKEIVQFTQELKELKDIGLKPKQGLYVQMGFENNEGHLSVKVKNTALYDGKAEITPFLNCCSKIVDNSWMISPNKSFESSEKGIHSCSPYCVGFKRKNLPPFSEQTIQTVLKAQTESASEQDSSNKKIASLETKLRGLGQEFLQKQAKGKEQIYERINRYFSKAFKLVDASEVGQLEVFRNALNSKEGILEVLMALPEYAALSDEDYIIFFLDVPFEQMIAAYNRYLGDSLFNNNDHNVKSEFLEDTLGASDFSTSFGDGKLFLTHRTASFDITGRISMKEANMLYVFEKILSRKVLPNPFPIFIQADEGRYDLPIFRENAYSEASSRIGYQEMMRKIADKVNENKSQSDYIGNYYLVYYEKSTIIDYDFVNRFEFELLDSDGHSWEIKDVFTPYLKMTLADIFDFQNRLLPILFNNILVVPKKEGPYSYNFFGELKPHKCGTSNNYLLIMKYRQAFYDFIYKSRRQAVTQTVFEDIMMTQILDAIRDSKSKSIEELNSKTINIKKKLNVLFSIHSNFQPFIKNPLFMANQTIQLRAFTAELAQGKTSIQTEAEFAFVAGQVIAYLMSKSKTADKSFARLEPFLQQTNLGQFQAALVNLFNRYKHENFSRRFKIPFSEVIGFGGSVNIKAYMPLLLSGFFSDNMLFSEKKEGPTEGVSENEQ